MTACQLAGTKPLAGVSRGRKGATVDQLQGSKLVTSTCLDGGGPLGSRVRDFIRSFKLPRVEELESGGIPCGREHTRAVRSTGALDDPRSQCRVGGSSASARSWSWIGCDAWSRSRKTVKKGPVRAGSGLCSAGWAASGCRLFVDDLPRVKHRCGNLGPSFAGLPRVIWESAILTVPVSYGTLLLRIVTSGGILDLRTSR